MPAGAWLGRCCSLRHEPRGDKTSCVIRSHFQVSDKNFSNSYHFLNVPSRVGAAGLGSVPQGSPQNTLPVQGGVTQKN